MSLPVIVADGPGWLLFEEPGGSLRLNVKRGWSPALSNLVKERGISKLLLSELEGPNVNFLNGLEPQLRSLVLSADDGLDISSVSGLSSLDSLSISGKLDDIDFTQLHALRSLSVNTDTKNLRFLECHWLEQLSVANVRLTDLTPLHKLTALRRLSCGNAALASLEGAQALPALRSLSVGGTKWTTLDTVRLIPNLHTLSVAEIRPLSDIQGIDHLSELRRLEFWSCKKLSCLRPISRMHALRALIFQEAGTITSLKPLRLLTELRLFHLEGKVADGSTDVLGYLPNLHFVAFRSYPQYAMSLDDVKLRIGLRGISAALRWTDVDLS